MGGSIAFYVLLGAVRMICEHTIPAVVRWMWLGGVPAPPLLFVESCLYNNTAISLKMAVRLIA